MFIKKSSYEVDNDDMSNLVRVEISSKFSKQLQHILKPATFNEKDHWIK